MRKWKLFRYNKKWGREKEWGKKMADKENVL
jgi:hypothetical protein